MRGLVGLAIVSFVLLSTACLVPLTDQADGAACTKADECKSARCVDGFCGGSSCKLNDASSCAAGWRCVHTDPDPISDFFGSDGSDTCRPTCGSCPGSMHCAEGGKEGETLCTSGKAPLALTIEATRVIAGQPSRLVAVAAPPAGRIASCEWSLGDGSARKDTSGPELTHVFDRGRTTHRVEVSCTDDGGRRGRAELRIDVACQPSSGACTPSACCEDAGFHCLPALAGGGNVCRAPQSPVLAVSGPNPIPIDTSGEYTASLSGGEGELSSVTWSFPDSSFTRQGITVSKSFSKAGIVVVTATASTTLQQTVQATYEVTVCQKDNGRCSDSEPCCAPLSCKLVSGSMRCAP